MDQVFSKYIICHNFSESDWRTTTSWGECFPPPKHYSCVHAKELSLSFSFIFSLSLSFSFSLSLPPFLVSFFFFKHTHPWGRPPSSSHLPNLKKRIVDFAFKIKDESSRSRAESQQIAAKQLLFRVQHPAPAPKSSTNDSRPLRRTPIWGTHCTLLSRSQFAYEQI